MSWLEIDPGVQTIKETLRRLGIKGVLYDLDDTLTYNSEIFRTCMSVYADVVAAETGIERDVFHGVLSDINDEEYKKMGVSPLRWAAVVEQLEEYFGDETGVIRGRLNLLMDIYTTEPRMRPGAMVTLRTMRDIGIKQGLVTHANVEWTNWKLDRLNLWNWFDAVLIADENGHKKAHHWMSAMGMLELDPEECLVVGDNLHGDIIPADSLGARTVWIPSVWSVSRSGTVPEKTKQIREFDEFLSMLDRLT